MAALVQDSPTPSSGPGTSSMSAGQARLQLAWSLACLGKVATTAGSVLSMWALDPSIFVLLSEHCGMATAAMAREHPSLHHAMVTLLTQHAATHAHFLSSSSLLSPSASSPTSGHLAALVGRLEHLLTWPATSPQVRRLAATSVGSLLEAVKGSAEVLGSTGEFTSLLSSTVEACYSHPSLRSTLLRNLHLLLEHYLPPASTQPAVTALLLHLVRSGEEGVSATARRLLALLPPQITFSRQRERGGEGEGPRPAEVALARIQRLEGSAVQLRAPDLKEYLSYLGGEEVDEGWLEGVVEGEEEQEGLHLLPASRRLQGAWLAWAAAHSTLAGKLRSPLGKAQETLGHLAEAARRLAGLPVDKLDLGRATALLAFVRGLEKCMVNSWDGSVAALPPATKSTQLFFHANKATCQSWLGQVRPALLTLAYHAGEYGEAARQAAHALPGLVKRGMEVEQGPGLAMVLTTALALARLDSPHGLAGLHAWVKERSGVRMRWVAALIELVRKETEVGARSLQAVLEGGGGLEQGLRLRLERELARGWERVGEHQGYTEWVASYRAARGEEVEPRRQERFLATLARFQDGLIPAALEGLEVEAEGTAVHHLLDSVHLHLLQAGGALQSTYMRSSQSWGENDRLSSSLEGAGGQLAELLTCCSTEDETRRALLLNLIHQEVAGVKERATTLLPRLLKTERGGSSSGTLLVIRRWAEFFLRFHKTSPECYQRLQELNLEVARVARKEKNGDLAASFILRSLTGRPPPPSLPLQEFLSNYDFFSQGVTAERAVALRQAGKLLLLGGGVGGEVAVRTVSGLVLAVGQQAAQWGTKAAPLLAQSSRALLNLATWLREEKGLLESVYPEMKSSSSDMATLAQVLGLESVTAGTRESLVQPLPLTTAATSTDLDLVTGRLLRLAVVQEPGLGKAWGRLADWSYSLGQRSVEDRRESRVELTAEEVRAVDGVLLGIGERERRAVQQVVAGITLKDSHLAGHQYERWDFMRRELLETGALGEVPDSTVQQLVVIWQAVFRRVFAHYELAAECYFRQLGLSTGSSPSCPATVSATLRLLHLAVTHPLELHEVLAAGLATTPASQWTGIIPQLFSRLNHPVPIVKQLISELLCRVSDTFPHLIVFPAVVGGLEAGTQASQALSALLCSGEESGSQGPLSQEEEVGGGQEMVGAHNRIVEVLRRKGPQAIEQVTLLVGELRRVTLLWDELWLGTLVQHSGEVQRQVAAFQLEADALAANSSLTEGEKRELVVEKYSIVFRRLLHLLDQVAAITRAAPETPHEEQFQRRFGKFISSTLEKVKSPLDWGKPTEGWAGLATLQQQLAARAGKRPALKLGEISPVLHQLRDTEIAMPGHLGDSLVTVARFDPTITILPTKTKPKKLSMMGSDGTKYTYLFKGLEDLHLDERIMQFLGVANQMMAGGGAGARYRARNYSVVPLGPRSGLIQWVGGAMPLFSLYKRWQVRQQAHLEAAKRTEEAAKVVSKPSDQFYSKMLPLLRKHGVTKMDDRKSWPVALLKQVLGELVAETPDTLLAQELWLGSTSSDAWWRLTQSITRSFAVMSVIGYILGLGDRHLDNVLVDLNKGHVVHIDYNISFEKGRNLRIPERVPCRLTQNIVSVFGVTGVEGLFRHSCEHTLGVLRRGRETLLTLLEAFVYDPLVDWTPGLGGGLAGAMYGGQGEQGAEGREEMESTLTFSMLGVRVAEVKGAWMDNRNDLVAGLIQVEDSLGVWLELAGGLAARAEDLASLHRSMSMLKEAEVHPGHRLHSLLATYRAHKEVEGRAAAARQQVGLFSGECDRMAAQHGRAIASVSGPQLGKWLVELGRLQAAGRQASSPTVGSFLEGAGQRELLGQYQGMEAEVMAGTRGLAEEVKRGLDQLGLYHALTSLYPPGARAQHRVAMYSAWGARLADTFTTETCDQVAAEFASMFSAQPTRVREVRSQHVRSLNSTLETWNSAILANMQRIYQRMMSENIMKVGREGLLEELGKTREMILNQLHHPESGVRGDTLVVFLCRHLTAATARWTEVERSLAQEVRRDKEGATEALVDQVFLQAGVISTILTTMDMLAAGSRGPEARALEAVQGVLTALQHLRSSFATIVMPEALKSFIKEDASVVEVGRRIEGIVGVSGTSLEEVRHETMLHTRCVMLGVDSPHLATVQLVAEMRRLFQEQVAVASAAEAMTTGQMLLCAANTLFDKVDGEMALLRERTAECGGAALEWARLGLVRAAAEVAGAAFSPTPGVWESLAATVFVAKLQLLRDFFSLCSVAGRAFQGEAVAGAVPTGETLVAPVRRFVTDFLALMVAGAGPRHAATTVAALLRHSDTPAVTNYLDTSNSRYCTCTCTCNNTYTCTCTCRESLDLDDLVQAVIDTKLASGALNQARVAKTDSLAKGLAGVVARWVGQTNLKLLCL